MKPKEWMFKDLLLHSSRTMHDVVYLNQSQTICNMNADCIGFVHVASKTHFKSNVSPEHWHNMGYSQMILLFAKICESLGQEPTCK
jgi:hypothetical protein